MIDLRCVAASSLFLFVAVAAANAMPPGERFHRDPDNLPGVTLVPKRPAALAPVPSEPFDQFDAWAADHQRGVIRGDGESLARSRRAAMAQLIERDPAEALRRAVGGEVRAKLPANVAAEVEEIVRGIGSLLVVCALPVDQKQPAEIQREVIVNGKHYRAFTSGKRLDQICAKETPIFGIAVGDVLALDEQPYRRLDASQAQREFGRAAKPVSDALTGAKLNAAEISGAIDEGDQIAFFGSDGSLSQYVDQNWTPYIAEFGGTSGGPGTTNSWTQGTRKFVAYRARLAEDATNYEPYALATGVSSFNTVSNWYYQWSYGSITMQFVVVTNVYVFTNSGAWYEANGGWPKLLADARTASLGTPEAYTNFNFDSVTHNWNVGTSGYAGIAYVGGRGVSFHEGYGADNGVIGHEHGHNLGLPHNNFWDTAGQSIIGPGTHSEYGNPFDIMGDGYGDWPFAANSRNRLAWLPDMHAAYNVTGTNRIYAMDQFPLFLPDTNSPVPYALAMPRDGRNYVFEFREDTNKIGASQVSILNGVLMEIDNGFGGGPELLDTTPGSPGGKNDAALTIGRMFTDPNVNVHVTPIARGPTSRTNWIDLVVNKNSQISNHPPAIAITAGSYTTAVGVAVTLTATASDPDGDALAYYWEFGDGTVSYDNTNMESKSWSAAGVYPVRCVAADMRGREAAAQVLVSVGTATRYTISGRVTTPSGQPVQGVRIASSGPTVYSDVDGRYVIANLSTGAYTVTANGADAYGNNYTFTYSFANPVNVGPSQFDRDIMAATVTGTNIGSGTGFLYERWEGIAGTTVALLTNNAAYPNSPTVQRVMKTVMEGPVNALDNYGTRLRAIFTAPLTGNYTFYIASDDSSELRFSTATNPATATRIAYVSGSTGSRAWTTYTNQKSAAIALVGGQKCYIEAIHKEGTGNDNIAVGCDLPDGTQERPIPYHRLDPWLADFPQPLQSVDIVATDASASEAGPDTGTFTLTRSGDVADDLTVTVQLTGDAQYGVDYAAPGLTAFFLAGETQAVVTVMPIDDAISEPTESVTATLIPGTAYAVGLATATIGIGDNEATTVAVTAPDPNADESGNSGRFQIARYGVSTGTIVVGLAISGTASNGVDFPALPPSITIPAGSSTVSLVVAPIADGISEIAELVTLTAQAGAGYALSSLSNATVTISADRGPGTGVLREWWTGVSGTLITDLTSNSNYPATPTGSEILTNVFECPTDWADNYGTRCRGYFVPPISGVYYFYIASDDYSELWLSSNATAAGAAKVAYVSGWTSSRAWTTYASQKSAAINLVTGQTYYIEALQKEGSGGDNLAVGVEFPGGYQEMPIPYHRLMPFDTQKPTISIVANDSAASELGDTGSVMIARSSEGLIAPFTIALTYDGTASNGVDFSTMPTQVTFAANVSNIWLQLTPTNDTFAEGTEYANVSIVSDGARFFTSASASNATIAIADDDIPSVAVAATSPYAYESGPTSSMFVILRTGSLVNPVTINYTLAGTATPGSDYDPLPGYFTTNGSVTLAAGQSATNLVLMPVNDSLAEGPETVVVQLATDPLYTIGTPASATISILDDDVSPVIVLNSPTAPAIRIPPGVGLILDATVTHNGLPNPPASVTQIWTQTSGPTNALLTTSNDWKNAAAVFPMIGNYQLRLSAYAGALTTTTNLSVSVGVFSNAAPLAWTNAGVGYVYPPTPSYSVTNGTNTIVVAGDNSIYLGMTYDDFGFTMTQVAGDCSITALVTSVQRVVSDWSRAGVMMRESLDKSSKSAFMGLAAGSASSRGGRFVTRATFGATNAQATASSLNAPYWVRLDRTGSVFRAFRSSSGTSWTQVGSDVTISMSNTVYVGIAASSGLTNSAGTYKFSGLGITAAGIGGAASNVGPNVSAGAATSANVPNPATLAGGATDDGLPNPPAAMSFAWSKVSGPGIVTIANAAVTNTTATFDTPGNYSLRLVASDGEVKTFSDTTVAATGFGVRIVATDPLAASPGTNTGTFVITRDGPTNASLTVNLSIGGTAVSDFDYVAIPTQAVIAAGQSNVAVAVSPVDFNFARDTVSVVIAIATSAAYAVESQSSDTVIISNTNLPVVTVVATDGGASEPPGSADTGTFLFSRAGGTNYPLTISFDVLGTAVSGVDFAPVTNTLTFAIGATNASVTVTPLDHVYGSAPLNVIASLSATDGTFVAGESASATVTITNKNFFALHLVWSGATNNLWDLATTPNWFATDIAASNVVFSNGYSVAFDDSPGVLTNVSFANGALLSPAEVVVNASTNLFALTGAGGIVGTCGVTKAGSQRFVLGGASNTFSGAVSINNGVLAVATTNALGSAAGGTFISGSGALDVNGLNVGSDTITISGAGFGGNGTIVNSGAQQINALQYVSLAADASIGGLVRWDVRAGTSPFVNLNGHTLTKTGTNYVALVSTTVTNTGDILVNRGTLAFSVNTLVSGPGAITINAGGTLALGNFGGSQTTLKPITINGGTLAEDAGSGGVTVGAPITLNAGAFTNIINTPDAGMFITNNIGGAGALVKIGANTLILTATNSWSGGTLVNAGMIQINNGGTLPGNVTNHGAVVFSRTDSSVFDGILSGTGRIVQSGSGVTRLTGTGSVQGGTNTISAGALHFAGGSFTATMIANGRNFNVQGGGTMLVTNDASVTLAGNLNLGTASASSGNLIQYGGSLVVNGTGDSSSRAVMIGEYATENSSFNLFGGFFAATNGITYLPWNAAQGLWNIFGGTAFVRQIQFNSSSTGTGTLNLAGGRIAVGSGGFSQSGGSAVINLGGGILGAYASWTSSLAMTLTGSNGNVTVDTATNTIVLTGALTGTGGLVKAGAGLLNLSASYGFSGGAAVSKGTLLLNGSLTASGVVIANGGTLAGTGTVADVVSNDGVVSPAATNLGTLSFSKSFTQSSNGVLQIQLASNALDRLVVAGAASLGGTLVVTAATNFVPATGSVFTVLNAGSVAGAFAATNLPPLPAHRAWTVNYTATSVVLAVAFTNRAPTLVVLGPHILALGAATNFAVTASDADGDATTVTNVLKPVGAIFTNGNFSWTASFTNWNTTNPVTFVATDSLGAASTNSTVIVVPYDFDGDGLPDNWEWKNFATLTNGASSDVTGKGASIMDDYVAGTDPTNRNSVFRVAAISNSPSMLAVGTVSGRVYRAWFTDDSLATSPAWSLFSNQMNGVGSWLETNPPPASRSFKDDFTTNSTGHAPTNGVRFYRVDVRLAP